MKYFAVAGDRQINVTFQYLFKKSVYPARDYSRIKYYFGEVVKKANEKIVLKRMLETES